MLEVLVPEVEVDGEVVDDEVVESSVLEVVVVIFSSEVLLPVRTIGRVIIRVKANTIPTPTRIFFQVAQLETVSQQLLLGWSFISLTFAMVGSEFETLKITQKFPV